MITVFGFEIALPQLLSFLSGTLGSFLGTILASASIALVLFLLIFVVLKLVFARTDTEVDDVILGVTRWPFIVFAILFGLERSTEVWKHEGIAAAIEKTLWGLIAITITYWVSKLIKEVALYQLEIFSKKSEASWDDVLAPVLKRVIPPLIWTIGAIITLGAFGLDLTGLYVALGGGAFILAFALQDILSNLFSGLVLLFDTPFQFGDVILLEDGKMAVVKEIGLRVTHLYNTQDHSDIFMPNSVLGGMSIVNITRPTTDLAESVTVGVAYTSDSKYTKDKVRKMENNVTFILKEVILGHPDVFGDIGDKLKALDKFSQFVSGKDKIIPARERLEIEQELNKKLEKLERQLAEFAQKASSLEQGGLDESEKKELRHACSNMLATFGLKEEMEHKGRFSRNKYKLTEDDTNDTLIISVRKWYGAWLKDPDLVVEDTKNLTEEWEQKLSFMRIKLERLYRYLINLTGHERRLDDEAQNLVKWIHDSFKESRVAWKDPDIRLVNFGPSSLDFDVSFYVDNIKLEHYERADRIKDELRREIKRRFDEKDENGNVIIEIPFPQTDIWFRNRLEGNVGNNVTKK
jgi:MscS family membrane protein